VSTPGATHHITYTPCGRPAQPQFNFSCSRLQFVKLKPEMVEGAGRIPFETSILDIPHTPRCPTEANFQLCGWPTTFKPLSLQSQVKASVKGKHKVGQLNCEKKWKIR